MGWWMILAFIGFTVLGEFLRPRIKSDGPQASGLGDFSFPTVDPTRAIPVAFGRVLCKGPNVVWYGDLLVRPIQKRVATSLFTSKLVTTGYRYYLGVQLGICHGTVDQFYSVRFGNDGEKTAVTTTSTVGDHLRVSMGSMGFFEIFTNPNVRMFGDEGGVAGDIDFYYGTTTQDPNDYLEAAIGTPLPGYRSLSYAVMRRCYVGNSPYIKNVAFEIGRFPNQLGLSSGKHIVGLYDANPACALYELVTNPVWGLGRASGEIDVAQWQAVGNTLFDEGMGVSIIFDRQMSARQMADEILRHVDGVIYTDPDTGLLRLVLVRADYDPLTIPVLDQSNVRDVEFSRGSWSELANTVRATYISRADNYTKRPAQSQNLAAVEIMGKVVSRDIEYLGASRASQAQALADRDMKTLSYPLAPLRVYANRKAYGLRPADVFVLNWPRLGFSGMVCRVLNPNYGSLENGEIELDVIEDIFSIASTAFTPPVGTGWTDPVAPVAAPLATRIFEAPFHLIGAGEIRALAAVVRASGGDLGWEAWSDRTGGTDYVLTNTAPTYAPSALLMGAYAQNTSALDVPGFVVDTARDLEDYPATITDDELYAGVNLVLVDDEVMGFGDVTDNLDGTWTIGRVLRGLLDTVPAAHADNARAYFIQPPGAWPVDIGPAYAAPVTIRTKILPFNGSTKLDIATAAAITTALAGRAALPYPPGDVEIGGAAWPTTIPAAGTTVVSWTIRHRVAQFAAGLVVAQDAGDFSAAPEGDYTIEVRVGAVLKRTVTALSAPSWSWTAIMKLADTATAGASVSIRVIPVNGSLVGTYQERLFTMT